MVIGVPMVAVPQWADQPTTAKYGENSWGNGVRMLKGLVKRDEVERCIREVIGSQWKDEYKKNAAMWMQKAKEAMQEEGIRTGTLLNSLPSVQQSCFKSTT
jgi:UDP:flavonoid glycosyltransferase YjiC (YdhE family)